MRREIYWQHEHPITCPNHHLMIWLGGVYWICETCRVIYVQVQS